MLLYKSIVFSALFLVVIVTAYDFQDESFNQYLARDLEEFTQDDTYVHYRQRRDEEAVNSGTTDKCRRRRFKGCCGDDIFESLHEHDRPIKKECFKKVIGKEHPSPPDPFKCDKTDRHRKNMTCVLQCLFEKKNVIDNEGNLKEEDFRKHTKEVFGKEEWLMSLVEKILPKCIDEAKKSASERDPKDPEACNPTSIKMVHCLFKEIQLNCPANQIKDEKACARLRERIQKNEFLGPHPPPQTEDD